jgi:hypothetical protein
MLNQLVLQQVLRLSTYFSHICCGLRLSTVLTIVYCNTKLVVVNINEFNVLYYIYLGATAGQNTLTP